ncbi:hypothetical protein [Streptomyces sp. NPDC012510]|uniref:hypothetical protein n=1 Tax=Streptomyces sp. NPDC012510 TaxID=3364838 RepID=UPI0036F017B1
MTDRIRLDDLTSNDLDQLYAELEALRAVARGYCPACGRGDAAPTVEDWEHERDRAQRAEAALREVLDTFVATHNEDDGTLSGYRVPCVFPDDMDRWRAALPEPGPATTRTTEAGSWLHAGTRDLAIPEETP